MRVVVWSERDEPYGDHAWRDCTYSSYLMGLVFAGYTAFPKGIYTVAEREQFERSDSRPNETGANLLNTDEAARNRYKHVLPTIQEPLVDALDRVGTLIVGQGVNGRLPSMQRRWDPSFAGGHAAAIIPIGGGKSRWLDPLASWMFAGDIVPNSVVLKWAAGVGSARIAKVDAFAPPPPKLPTFHVAPGVYTTYRVLADGRAQAIGILPTKGFGGTYQLITARQNDGTGSTTLMRITSGLPAPLGYKGKILYRFAPGVSLLS